MFSSTPQSTKSPTKSTSPPSPQSTLLILKPLLPLLLPLLLLAFLTPYLKTLPTFLSNISSITSIPTSKLTAYIDSYHTLYDIPPSQQPISSLKDFEKYGPGGYTPFQGAPDVLEDLYVVVSKLCGLGSLEKIYIPPLVEDYLNAGESGGSGDNTAAGGVLSTKTIIDNQLAYENKILAPNLMSAGPLPPSASTGVNSETTASYNFLDLGSGAGHIAHNLMRNCHLLSDSNMTVHCSVIGLNVDSSQIVTARALFRDTADFKGHRSSLEVVQGEGVGTTTGKFIKKSYNEAGVLSGFADNSFSGVYTVQGSTFMYDPPATFKELYRILKPGGKIVFLDHVMLDGYEGGIGDGGNETQWEMMLNARKVMAAGGSWHYKYWEYWITSSGFQITHRKIFTDLRLTNNEDKYFHYFEKAVQSLASVGMVRKEWVEVVKQFRFGAGDLMQCQREGFLAMNWHVVATKPE